MVDTPNIFEKALKNTGDFVDDNITGALGSITDSAATKMETAGAMDRFQGRKLLPVAAGGAATVVGVLLLQPINWVVNGTFSLLKNIVTGFGYLEKIPLIGGLFSALGKGIEIVGKYAGYVVPAIAGFIGYKAFQSNSREEPPPTLTEIASRAADESTPAAQAALAAIAVGSQSGLQSTGRRVEVLRQVIGNPEPNGKPATTRQVERLKGILGEDGYTRITKELFSGDDTKLTKGQADKLLHQADGLRERVTQARVSEIEASKPKRSAARSVAEKIPGVKKVAGWVSKDTGLSAAERSTAARVEAATSTEQEVIRGRVAEQLSEEITAAKKTSPRPVEVLDSKGNRVASIKTEPGFFSGTARPGFSTAAGLGAGLGSAMVIIDKDAGTGAKIVAGGAGLTGTTAVVADLAGAAKLARGAGIAGVAVTAPLNALNAVESFTKKDATKEDYLEGAINSGYATGSTLLLTPAAPIGAVILATTGTADIGHKGYKIGTGIHEVGKTKEYIDSSFEPNSNAAATGAAIQGKLYDKLVTRGVRQIPWGDNNTLLDLREHKDQQIALGVIAIARDNALREMERNNVGMLPRFFSFTDEQKKKQTAYESARLDYLGYQQAIREFDWYVEDQKSRLADHVHIVADAGEPQVTVPSTPTISDKDKGIDNKGVPDR